MALGLAEFMPRIGNSKNNSWFVRDGKRIAAGITIDGEDLGDNIAHLRWFIVDKQLQSSGVGRRLLAKSLEFCEQQGFRQIDLWTLRGLMRRDHFMNETVSNLSMNIPTVIGGQRCLSRNL
ncbi:MAG: GNAT family N-acetyltransferase [Emcibacteraceae bacterium]